MTIIEHKPLGQLLIRRGLLQEPQLDRALAEQRQCRHQKLLGEILVELKICSEEQVAQTLAEADGLPFVRVSPKLADPKVVALLPHEFLERNGVLPLFLVEGVLTVAVSEPANLFLLEEIERRTGHRVQIVAATGRDIRATLHAYLPGEKVFVVDEVAGDLGPDAFKVLDPPTQRYAVKKGEAPVEPAVLKLVEYCVYHSLKEGASEVHVEPGDTDFRIRYRIDGRLVEKLRPPLRLHGDLVGRIKRMAGLDSKPAGVPQEGRLRLAADKRPVTFLVITVPTRSGEKLVLRVTDDDRGALKLEKLGFSYEMLKQWRKLITMPAGLVLVTGPAGSGKRATLYSSLQERNTPDANLCSVEDPVEHALPGVNQFSVDESASFGFPAALRAVLRQQPDVLMISDVRDADTARLAAQAALGGKLVLAGMHAADVPSALARLAHLGLESHLLGATVGGVLARRLVRKLCPGCREAYEPTLAEKRQTEPFGGNLKTLYRAHGCDRCRNLGYAGRIGIHELLIPDDSLSDRLSQGIPLSELRTLARHSGLKSLRADGVEKARTGLTTLDEVFRVTT
ncbi:MAG: ral secretion pathway protein [Phycisphaerales bacterium]|jgi:type IV pilus assembly protein PilB|nr:ral secretion pathway protein [Phycisphaerales bacterium]